MSVSVPVLLFYAATAAFLYVRTDCSLSAVPFSGPFSVKKIFKLIYRMIVCYCALILSALFWNYIAKLSGKSEIPPFIFPNTIDKRLLLFASSIVLAAYEEMLFRFFLPERGLAIIHSIAGMHKNGQSPGAAEKSKLRLVLTAAAELIPIVLFALAHRYLGLFAVCNALCAAVILRLALYKKLHIAVLCAVHAAYNITIFIALSCIRS